MREFTCNRCGHTQMTACYLRPACPCDNVQSAREFAVGYVTRAEDTITDFGYGITSALIFTGKRIAVTATRGAHLVGLSS